MLNWDDFRFVLAVTRMGSALGAARTLGVNQTTVVRRIAHMEEVLGGVLFERKQSGLQLTPFGQRVATAAARVESEILALESALHAEQRELSGKIRFTCSESVANIVVMPCLREFRSKYPDIIVDLIADDRFLDLAVGEADVALRAGSRPEGAGIVARRLQDSSWSVYCSKAYAEQHGHPKTAEELDGHLVVGMQGPMGNLPFPLWLARMTPNSIVAVRSNSLTNLVSALKSGLGVGMLPCLVGDVEPDLQRCLPPIAELDTQTWLVLREDLKHSSHVRAFADFISAYVQRLRGRFAGTAPVA
jgi:DNA-binding transcriptional LysR family regulator